MVKAHYHRFVGVTVDVRGESRADQLQKVLESQAFRNTEVLKRLLEYLGRKALAGDTGNLKEYTVGLEAFGKPQDYDPKIDSSVRVQAGKLRQKLDEYYRTEGADDPFVIELPKGHFALQFREREPAAIPSLPPSEAVRTAPILPWLIAGLMTLTALVALIVSFRIRREETVLPRYRNADVLALWQPFLEDNRPAMISLGAPLFAKIGNGFYRDPQFGSWERMEASPGVTALESLINGKAFAANPYTGVGEASAAFELARLFVSAHKDLNLVVSSSLTWEDIGRNNVIFAGPPKFNLQTNDLPVTQDFIIKHAHIENIKPLPGEPGSFDETRAPDGTLLEGHALITRLPGLHGAGYVMMLASTSTEGTRAAVEYVTRPDYAARLVASLRRSHNAIPPYFQAVVRARFKSQTPIQMDQVAVHVVASK